MKSDNFLSAARRSLVIFGVLLMVPAAGAQGDGERSLSTTSAAQSSSPVESDSVPDAGEIEAEIRTLLDQQLADWNAGNIRGFMNGYSRSDSLRFISNGTMRTGWQTSLYAYVRNYPDRASMGTLSFEDLHMHVLSPDAALVYGRYRLRRADDEPLGLFSLVVVREDDGWRIIHDHTSSSP